MSTFLQLAQRLRQEAGASGTGPDAVTGQVGESARFVSWIASEYTLLQMRHQTWRWLRKSFTLSTVASDDTYAYGDCTDTVTLSAITRFTRWYPDEFRIYLTSAGVGTRHILPYCDWDSFKVVFKTGSINDGYPSIVTINPLNNIVLGAPPDAAYTLSGDYQASPQVLAANGDTPEMPSQFHDLIWLGALRRYAAYESAPEVWTEAKDQHSTMLRALIADQLPPGGYGDPLA